MTDELVREVASAVIGVALRHMEKGVKAMRCDVSAAAPEHIIGYEAGYRAAKREMLDLLAELQ